jgi:outer membrane protein assembly factor BamB
MLLGEQQAMPQQRPRLRGAQAVVTVAILLVARVPLGHAHADSPKQDVGPFESQASSPTHRGNPQRTGSDGGPGPSTPNILWVYKSDEHFVAPLVAGPKDLYAASLGPFNSPVLRALSLAKPPGAQQVRWELGAPYLRLPIAGAPILIAPTKGVEALVFGDGFHTDEGSSIRCVRAADGFPLWQLALTGKLVHVEGTPTSAGGKLYVGGGNAGVLCLDPRRATFEGKEQNFAVVQPALEKRWQELLAKYEIEKKKDPDFAVPPDKSMLPRAVPKQLWQKGQESWHVDAPVAVAGDRVLATSAYLDDEKTGERALICLKADDGTLLWKTPMALNPWAGPTIGPCVLVGCSTNRLDSEALAGARGEVVAMELDTGKIKWRKQIPGGVLSSVAVKGGLAIFTATDGKVRAWDAETGREKWSYDARAPFFAGPAVTQNTVYAADLQSVVHAINLASGKKQWTLALGTQPETKTQGLVYGSPIVCRGRLYVATCNLNERGSRTSNVVVCIGEK